MKIVFEKLGYTIERKTSPSKMLGLYQINNPDGSVRWIWPAHLSQPLFLKFYNVSGFKAKATALATRMIFFLHLQRWCFRMTRVPVEQLVEFPVLDLFADQWALFMGTAGPNNKAILYAERENQGTFFKIGTSRKSSKMLENESNALLALTNLQPQSFDFPAIVRQEPGLLAMSDCAKSGKRSSFFSRNHAAVLLELQQKTGHVQLLQESDCWKSTLDKLEVLRHSTDSRLPRGLIQKLELLTTKIGEPLLQFTLAHGDFTPWNQYSIGGRPAIYDWEMSHPSLPFGFDAFHFIFQQGILVERTSWQTIKERIDASELPWLFKQQGLDQELYLELYLTINIANYLTIYAQQDQWHVQIHWLLQTWNEALSDILQKTLAPRKLMILDIFDFLQGRNYAALKFPEVSPELVSEHSDIDLCITHKDKKPLLQFIQQHPLALAVHSTSKSFMVSLLVYFRDNATLSVDILWQLKRKSLVMMDGEALLASVERNKYGVKVPSEIDQARFVGLFYLLNNASIPQKYKNLADGFSKAVVGLDRLLLQYYHTDEVAKNEVIKLLAGHKENRGVRGLVNQVQYAADALRSSTQRGIILTFSGVDGAGKSTVIDAIKHEFEKKLRRRVVVIRHRPSLLPILSAWRQGKVQAEAKAASTLPRQGTNRSFLSSLLRFVYYYSDYLFGQFYVYFKYVCRGYVVLYDRYYFDFINDSQRSNIGLPKAVTAFGYHFLLKPDYNFFLYAAPELILKRKQELNQETIIRLTADYKGLFAKLQKSVRGQYVAIENIVLKDTIHQVMATTKMTVLS